MGRTGGSSNDAGVLEYRRGEPGNVEDILGRQHTRAGDSDRKLENNEKELKDHEETL